MDTISDWLNLHDLEPALVRDVITARHAGNLSGSPLPAAIVTGDGGSKRPCEDLRTCFQDIVVPALAAGFPDEIDVNGILRTVRFEPLPNQPDAWPHTIENFAAGPTLVMNWQATVSDLVCLAHEAAHALQSAMSSSGRMPPMAREVCAFLGELLLLRHARDHAPGLASAICEVWETENEAYLGTDLDALSDALSDPGRPYHYRQNYALARLAAVAVARRGWGPWLAALFASGPRAMELLPFARMADRAGDIPNYLPPMAVPDPAHPTVEAYRSLGAMALLDIDYLAGESEQPMGAYFNDKLNHLRSRTAFVALDADHKPIGYATWDQVAGRENVTLTRQTAPFGDHLVLQWAVERRLGTRMAAGARHIRSARKEQSAW